MKDLVQDGDSLVGASSFEDGVDRRGFIKAAIGTGFAAAVLPVEAQTLVQTDTAGLATQDHLIVINGQEVPVYRAQPEGKTNPPVILVISEIFGVHEHIKDVARRFAKQGYMALAPDLFVRAGDAGKEPNIADLMKNIVGKTPDAQVMLGSRHRRHLGQAEGWRYRAARHHRFLLGRAHRLAVFGA